MTRKFTTSQNGSVAIVTALTLTVVLAGAGASMDYMNVSNARSQLMGAADSAVLSATSRAKELTVQNLKSSSWKAKAKKVVAKYFTENAKLPEGAELGEPVVSFGDDPDSIDVKLAFTAKVPTTFLRVVGKEQIEIGGEVSAKVDLKRYIRVNFILDNSASMGIMSTPEAITQLQQETKPLKINGRSGGCAFACHYNEAMWDIYQNSSVKGLARIDVAGKAINKIITSLKDYYPNAEQVEIGLYTFSNELRTIEAGTTDMDSAAAKAKTIELVNERGEGGTNFHYSINEFATRTETKKSGMGNSAQNRRTITVILTDGVDDSHRTADPDNGYKTARMDENFVKGDPYFYNKSRAKTVIMQPMFAKNCDALKAGTNGKNGLDHKVITFELEYLTPYNSDPGVTHEERFAWVNAERDTIRSELVNCASDTNMAFWAHSLEDINTATDKIIDVIGKQNFNIRLTN